MNYRVSPEHQRQPRNRPSEELVHRRAQAHPSPQGSMDLLKVGEERRKAQREGGGRCPLVLMLEGFIPVLCPLGLLQPEGGTEPEDLLGIHSIHSHSLIHSADILLCFFVMGYRVTRSDRHREEPGAAVV